MSIMLKVPDAITTRTSFQTPAVYPLGSKRVDEECSDEELATIPHNAMAQNDASLTGYSTT